MTAKIEILAPAGDYETLKAAVCAGADAVYAGGERFGARAYAKNFSKDELLSAIDYVHIHGKKLYLTVNTLVKEREFPELYDYLLPFYRQGLDAVIVQDVGVMEYIHIQFPGLSVHASTQMTITNVISARYLEQIGIRRIVPARELSLREIREIRENTKLEIECFVHGALCYCYSGQCLLSSMIGGRSGNRGQCAQPCRLPYQAGEGPARDLLSLKDLCMIQAIPDLIESGIWSFKIEGRMKQPGYVAVVTGMYRRYVDLYLRQGREGFHVSDADLSKLQHAYQRRGYCDGYYYRHNGKEMLSLERPKPEPGSEWKQENKVREKMNGRFALAPGRPASLYLQYQEIETEVLGPAAEPAKKQPVSEERILKQLRKTGNTEFVFDKLDIHIEGEVFYPVQEVNELRRKGVEELKQKILQGYFRESKDRIRMWEAKAKKPPSEAGMQLTVAVESLEQLEAAVKYPEVARIYVEDALWALPKIRERLKRLTVQAKQSGKSMYFSMARIFRKEAEAFYDQYLAELAECFDGALVRNLESCLYMRACGYDLPVITDSSIYQWNRAAVKWWEDLSIEAATAPVELNKKELEALGMEQMECIVYGYLPVMVSAGCVRRNTEGCGKRSGYLSIRDRLQKKNIVKNECVYCYNVIYNSIPLLLADQYGEVKALSCGSVRLQFSVETGKETEDILNLFKMAYLEGKKVSLKGMDFTRGHFKRGVK